MPVLNWPPLSAPAWPPAGFGGRLEFADIRVLLLVLRDEYGFTQSAPTTAERTAYFNAARCDEGHQVTGRMIVSPSGTRYPFAICQNASHRQLLVLWGPDYCMGGKSGEE